MIRARNVEGAVRSLQMMDADGSKRFYPGSQHKGNSHQIGERKLGEPILIAEGYATAASIHEATGRPVIVAFDAGNLKPVAQALHAKDPDAPILICADNDQRLGGSDKNAGVHQAKEAAEAVEGRAVAPSFTTEEKRLGDSDWNDMSQRRGLRIVGRYIDSSILALKAEKDKALEQKQEQSKIQDQERQAREKSWGLER